MKMAAPLLSYISHKLHVAPLCYFLGMRLVLLALKSLYLMVLSALHHWQALACDRIIIRFLEIRMATPSVR